MSLLKLCIGCKKKNRALAGRAVYMPLGHHTTPGTKRKAVLSLKEQGLANSQISRKTGMCLRQVVRIVGESR